LRLLQQFVEARNQGQTKEKGELMGSLIVWQSPPSMLFLLAAVAGAFDERRGGV
jgi:hypothetical protein